MCLFPLYHQTIAVLQQIADNNAINWRYEKNTNSDAWKDVFGRLGDVAGVVLKALETKQYKSIYAIVKDTGAAESSVRRAVQRLIAHGLAIHSEAEGLYYANPVTEAELFNLSVKLQTNGRAELQRIGHRTDREIFLNRNMAKVITANDINKKLNYDDNLKSYLKLLKYVKPNDEETVLQIGYQMLKENIPVWHEAVKIWRGNNKNP